MHDHVKDYYGCQLQGTADLRTTACCDASQTPDWLKPLLARIHPEVTARYYGCGLVCPPQLGGSRVLDLGYDVYALAQLVGEGGQVVGVDMTEAQLAVAERYRAYHRQAFGFACDNVELRLVEDRPIAVTDPALAARTQGIGLLLTGGLAPRGRRALPPGPGNTSWSGRAFEDFKITRPLNDHDIGKNDWAPGPATLRRDLHQGLSGQCLETGAQGPLRDHRLANLPDRPRPARGLQGKVLRTSGEGQPSFRRAIPRPGRWLALPGPGACRPAPRAGVSLKPQHVPDIPHGQLDLGFCEVHAENYLSAMLADLLTGATVRAKQAQR